MEFTIIEKYDIQQYKKDMQEAFQLGAIEGDFPIGEEMVLPESHIDQSLNKEGAIAYKAVLDGVIVGGAIVVINKQHGHLDFLYVKHGIQGKGIGKFMWFEIKKMHPEVKVWKTCTPYFEKRNIHFYINVCGFHVVEYFNSHHKDPNEPEDFYFEDDGGMFGFEKVIA